MVMASLAWWDREREREKETWTKTFCSVISGFMVSKEGRGNRVIYGAERFCACHKQSRGLKLGISHISLSLAVFLAFRRDESPDER